MEEPFIIPNESRLKAAVVVVGMRNTCSNAFELTLHQYWEQTCCKSFQERVLVPYDL